MTKQVALTIDGKQVTVAEGMLVVDAAKSAGIDVPVFCYHPKDGTGRHVPHVPRRDRPSDGGSQHGQTGAR